MKPLGPNMASDLPSSILFKSFFGFRIVVFDFMYVDIYIYIYIVSF